MELSIVIPVYKVETTLDRCLESIMRQSFQDFEIILIDDGSPDRCPELCDAWAAKDSRIRVFHQHNNGLSAARNTGLDHAQGQYITFIDSDDYIGPNTLQSLLPEMTDASILEYPVWLYYGSQYQRLLSFEERIYEQAADYWLSTQAYLHSYACNKIYHRSLFNKIKFPENRVFEDVSTLSQLLKLSPRVKTTNKGIYYYCFNPNGITANAKGTELRQLLDAHLTARMPMDNRYFSHLLNIQLDVMEQTGDKPRLETKGRKLPLKGNPKQLLKGILFNTLGINGICRINKFIHRIQKPSHL
jgi:glycosyltransferase involved in cell wall biosynthesis